MSAQPAPRAPGPDALAPPLLARAYRRMALIRAFEERLHVENTTGDVPGFVHLYAGQEAIAVGVCEHLGDSDYLGSTHRGHGHCIAKGCDVVAMMCEIFGRAPGLCGGKGGSMHIADLSKGMLGANAIVGGAAPLAIGAALTHKTKGSGGVAVAFTGDGGSNQGMVFEAMNMAVVLALPVLFVFENNGYGEGTGADYAVGSRSIAERAAGFGMPSVQVDGTDFFAVHAAAGEAVARARAGLGPSAIEAKALRWYGHYEGDPMNYRAPDEVARARAERDPLALFRARVAGRVPADELAGIDAQALAEVDAAVRTARAAPFPEPTALERDVYVAY
ncbi:MAG: thiamine pyrophosphate-dependent dehydrogenase E1 component subunit alpha [Steroidobacteraceae bacterium]|nr:thiamine pyrophosphate-dependent dehydrogenase E1 component subunit alpha [Steroidobacteraceae bacterium]